VESKIAIEMLQVTVVDENGNRTTRSVAQKKAGFTVTIKPASAAEKRLRIATRALRERREALKGGPFLAPESHRKN